MSAEPEGGPYPDQLTTTVPSALFFSSYHSQFTAPVGLKSPPRLTMANTWRAVGSASLVSLTMIVRSGKTPPVGAEGSFQYSVSGGGWTPPSPAPPSAPNAPASTGGRSGDGVATADGQE